MRSNDSRLPVPIYTLLAAMASLKTMYCNQLTFRRNRNNDLNVKSIDILRHRERNSFFSVQ